MGITIASIGVLALCAWLANKTFKTNICPICAGTALTWIWMLAARSVGYDTNPVIIGILMGGSVVGIAYMLERHIAHSTSAMIWKLVFIPAGFATVYGIIASQWPLFWFSAFILAIAGVFARKQRRVTMRDDKKIQELKQKMRRCC